uniref:Methyltransf_11 domain-containing protein n=1 Tax=Caenorhabditis japonica TaxID=281687 RepID=A0A8R1E139_CAEJA
MHLDYPNFKDLEILEVSCGQGHSLELIERLHGPTKLLVGCDKVVVNSERNIVYGDAINLPFEDDSFDFVVNVEASHLYSDYPKFFQEVARVLKPGGVFCWMDIRYSFEIFPTQFAAEEAGLNLRRWESCNKEVIEGIKKVSKKYDEKLEKAPFYVKIFKNSLRDTYCAPGTEAYERLRTGKKKYLAAMWIKE